MEEFNRPKNENVIENFKSVKISERASDNKPHLSSLLKLQQQSTSHDDNSSVVKSDTSNNDIADSSSKLADNLDESKRISYSGKPPNVLVFTGSNDNDDKRFLDVRSLMIQCLARDKYVIYHLKRDQVTMTPWIENTILLVLVADKVPKDGVYESFLTYFSKGGSVMSLSSDFDEHFLNLSRPERLQEIIKISYKNEHDVNVFGCSSFYDSCVDTEGISIEHLATNSDTGKHVISQARHQQSNGVALLSLVSFEKGTSEKAMTEEQFVALKLSNPSRIEMFGDLLDTIGLNCTQSDPPSLSHLVLHATSQKSMDCFFSSINKNMNDNVYSFEEVSYVNDVYTVKVVSYEFLSSKEQLDNYYNKPCQTHLAVIKSEIKDVEHEFDFETYDKNLESSVLGNVVIFGSVVTTTMTIMEHFMDNMSPDIGLVAIAASQTEGKGRSGNVWLSPKGCGMFSLHVRISQDSPLGKYVSCFQHLVALGAVLAVRSKKGYEDFDLRIKWPNDIYYGNKIKLGGILVKSSITGGMININLGCGVNISNRDPTTCLNDTILQHNNSCASPDDHLGIFSVEEFVARYITQIELLINQYQEDGGSEFYDLYHKYWLHSNQEIHLYKMDGPKGKVLDITREGYLFVQLEDGHLVEVHPDGNSFDMMRNLIIAKLFV